MSDNFLYIRSLKVDWLKLRRKFLYCFVIFAIINEKLIKKDRPICMAFSHSPLLPHSPLRRVPNIRLQWDDSRRRALLLTQIGRPFLFNFSLTIAKITK